MDRFFRRLKWWIMGVTLAIYYVTPWIRRYRSAHLPDQAVLIITCPCATTGAATAVWLRVGDTAPVEFTFEDVVRADAREVSDTLRARENVALAAAYNARRRRSGADRARPSW